MILKKGHTPLFLITVVHFATTSIGENLSIPTVTQDESDFGGVIAILFGVAVDCVAIDADATFPIIEADGIMFYAHDGSIEQAFKVCIVVLATILLVRSFDVAVIRQDNAVIGDFGDAEGFLEGDGRFDNFHCCFLPCLMMLV